MTAFPHLVGNAFGFDGLSCRITPFRRTMAAAMRDTHEICDKHNDVATASLLEDYIDETERRTWFLFEAVQGADDTGH